MTVVAGGSLMRRTLTHLREAGVTDVTVVLGQNGDKVRTTFNDGQDIGLSIAYVEQDKPRGIADAMLAARRRFNPGEYFILVYGDVATSANPVPPGAAIVQLLQGTDRRRLPARPADRPLRQRLPERDAHHQDRREADHRPAWATTCWPACSSCPSETFSLLERWGDMEKVFGALIESPSLNASIWEEGWIDVEYPWDVLAANRMVMDTWEQAEISRNAVDRRQRDAQRPGAHRGRVDHQVGRGAGGPVLHRAQLLRRQQRPGPLLLVARPRLDDRLRRGAQELRPLRQFQGRPAVVRRRQRHRRERRHRLRHDDDQRRTSITAACSSTCSVRPSTRASAKLGAFIGDDVKIGAGNTLAAGTVLAPGTTVPHHATVGGGR